ncbi:MAG TPA: dihydrofolate reductase family protein [Patescibacteria group bacterium]|nr:dihydrofolate reductase family protein [Patescibacteria group bacterium]
MKITLVAVTSLDGCITYGDETDIYKWTSPEDQDFFFKKIQESKLIIMGSGTYEVIKSNIQHSANRLRVVLTKHPEKYKKDEINGQLEFSDEMPSQLINRLSSFEEALLLGGSKVYSSFMRESLVDEIYLTIEPTIFGKGKRLFNPYNLRSNWSLVSFKKLNDKGTILLRYKLVNPQRALK